MQRLQMGYGKNR